MKENLIKRMFLILIITTLLASGGVYTIVYFTAQNAAMDEARARAISVKDYILLNVGYDAFIDIGKDTDAGRYASGHVQEVLDSLRGIGGLRRLYIAAINENGDIVTTMDKLTGHPLEYRPSDRLEMDLRRSLAESEAMIGDRIYRTGDGDVLTIFWPVTDQFYQPLGVVCMEFDVDFMAHSARQALRYSLILSGGLLIIISVISYLSMSRVSEPYFKKLAYTDFLTGYENRMAFEHRMREVSDLAQRGGPVAMIICDVNNLKKINDTQGHKVGDAYIKNTADIISMNLRDAGPLYRIGGDEFASIITYKEQREIDVIMDALQRENRIAVPGQHFSCACGYAIYTRGVHFSMRDVFKDADEAMYKSKALYKAGLIYPFSD